MTASPQPNFDRVAHVYRWAEYLTLGPLLQRTRAHFLPLLPPRRHAVALGDGDGRFLALLLARQPQLRAIAVDTSAAMLQLLRRRCHSQASRLQTIKSSALTFTPSEKTDLVITHFFLDCLTQTELDSLTRSFADRLKPGTLWLLSDFGQPSSRPLRPFAALYVRALYLAFRILTGLRVRHLPNPQQSLRSAGFERLHHKPFCFGLLYTEIWRKR